MQSRAEVVIIGGGIMGLSIAYQLAKRGITDVLVVERSYLCGGASGRNGGGVRAQWSSETNIQLMQQSIQMCRDFASEMKINIWFRQGGYLFLARTEEKRRALEQSVALQNQNGLPTRMLAPHEARQVVPELSTDGLVAASFNPDDGVVFPWPFVWGFAKGAEKYGVKLLTFTELVDFETSGTANGGAQIEAVRIAKVDGAGTRLSEPERVETRCVINACGAWSPEIAKKLSVDLPNHPHRHEICSTEPLKPWLGPLIADLSNGLYFSQSTRGEIVGGVTQEKVPDGINQDSSWNFLAHYANALVRTVPIMGEVRVLRQWAGCYDLTPDANPILGFVDEVEGFYQASGFMGHGFMMAPIVGKLIAEHLATKKLPDLFARWNLRRFKEGKLLSEAMIIG
jgi:sarcosine oxidase, subunit beta